jgi:hypothetical protein
VVYIVPKRVRLLFQKEFISFFPNEVISSFPQTLQLGIGCTDAVLQPNLKKLKKKNSMKLSRFMGMFLLSFEGTPVSGS